MELAFVVLKLLHLLGVVIWVGGMFFAHFFLRPAVQALQPPDRLRLMRDVLSRFFSVVLAVVVVMLVSGLGIIALMHSMTAKVGAHFNMPESWIVMSILGLIMMAIFGHIRFALYKRLDRAVTGTDWAAAAKAMESIRKLVALNLAIGLVIIVVLRLPL